MATRRGFEIPELFPQPKQLVLNEGISELAIDVRLSTSNVLPLQRKAVRSVLSAAGVRVVANKKKYVVEAKVEDAKDFDLTQVPEHCRKDYYELTVSGSEVHIRSPYQDGMVWAAQTLATLFTLIIEGKPVPNFTIRDWPTLPVRGIFIENKWGPDRMLPTDWFQAIDAVSSVKMNTLGIGLYGCWGSCRLEGENKPSEFLFVPSADEELADLHSEHRLRWYDPAGELWHDETYLPFMFENDTLAEIINYGKERGVNVIPFFNSLGHNTLLPRLRPEISARDEDGKPTGVGYCTTAPETRKFLEKLYGGIVKKYYPDGLEYFHLELDEVWPTFPHPEDALKKESPWCCCPTCKGKDHGQLFQDHLLWLVEMLTNMGVQKVVFWNDQLTRHDQLLDEKFVRRLEEANLKDRVVIHWWWYDNHKMHDGIHPQIATKLGLNDNWVAPMTCYYNWTTYSYHRPNIEKMLVLAEKEGATGAVSYSVHDPSHLDHEALLGAYAWESPSKAGKMAAVQARWTASSFGAEAALYNQAVDLLTEVSLLPSFDLCRQYHYCYSGEDLPVWPRAYPQEALDRLAELPEDDVPATLRKAAASAQKAADIFEKLLLDKKLSVLLRNALMSLLADAVRAQALAELFAWLLETRTLIATKPISKELAKDCEQVRAKLLAMMKIFDANKPSWVSPVSLQPFSYLLLFLDQLKAVLKTSAGKMANNKINWTLPQNWQIPENFL